MAAPEKVKAPASNFPSIEKTYGHPMGHGHANAVVAHGLVQAKL
jgi:hypothetical protein